MTPFRPTGPARALFWIVGALGVIASLMTAMVYRRQLDWVKELA